MDPALLAEEESAANEISLDDDTEEEGKLFTMLSREQMEELRTLQNTANPSEEKTDSGREHKTAADAGGLAFELSEASPTAAETAKDGQERPEADSLDTSVKPAQVSKAAGELEFNLEISLAEEPKTSAPNAHTAEVEEEDLSIRFEEQKTAKGPATTSQDGKKEDEKVPGNKEGSTGRSKAQLETDSAPRDKLVPSPQIFAGKKEPETKTLAAAIPKVDLDEKRPAKLSEITAKKRVIAKEAVEPEQNEESAPEETATEELSGDHAESFEEETGPNVDEESSKQGQGFGLKRGSAFRRRRRFD